MAEFQKVRTAMLDLLPKWSFILGDGSSPCSLAAVHDTLPEPFHHDFLTAVDDGETLWVEKSDLYKVASVYAYGGLALDALDQKVLDPAGLEACRAASTASWTLVPFPVPTWYRQS